MGGVDIKYRSYNIFAPVLNSFGVVTLLCLCRRSSLLLKMSLKYLGLRVTMSATNFSRVQKNRQHIGIMQTHVHMGERDQKRPDVSTRQPMMCGGEGSLGVRYIILSTL